jgi:hypothetical protein
MIMDFNFITEEQFRKSLISDYSELTRAQEAKLWKSVHVLAGSIIEALLIEYILVFKLPTVGTKDPLKMDLSEAVEVCEGAGVIHKGTASLCDVVREYRNLIHPGRIIRLDQDVTEESANIASNLVRLITREVAQKRKDKYGPTAGQIVKKLRADEHVSSVLRQLLAEANRHERLNLVDQSIPEAYAQEELFIPDETVLARLRLGFREGFDLLGEAEKTRVATKFAQLVRTDSTEKIQEYGDAFFKAEDIQFLSSADQELVIGHLLSRLDGAASASEGIFRTSVALGKFIGLRDMERFADTLIKLVLRQTQSSLDESIRFVFNVYDHVDSTKKSALEARLAVWLKRAESRKAETQVSRLESISGQWIDLPF